MRNRILLAGLVVVFVAGLAKLFDLRFRSGDLYPRYSSLRADPEGLRVLYESLRATADWDVQRSFQPLAQLRGTGQTLLLAGVNPFIRFAGPDTFKNAERIARAGNRVVIACNERAREFGTVSKEKPAMEKMWNVAVVKTETADSEANETGMWPISFRAAKEWTILRREEGRPVVIERSFGNGTVVLIASSYLLTNAAMQDDLRAGFLLQALGGEPAIRFDETHLGLEQRGTIMGLARHFRLQGLMLGLVLLAALFLWRNSSTFPPRKAATVESSASGRDALSGLAILLQRNLAAKDLLAACVHEREKASRLRDGTATEEMERIARERMSPAIGFREIQALLAAKRKFS